MAGAALGMAPSTPVATYRDARPYVLLTLLPLIALIRYQLEPDLALGQVVLQCEPLTVATTVTVALGARWVRTGADNAGPVRTFTPEQAGIIVVELAAAAGETATRSPAEHAEEHGKKPDEHMRAGAVTRVPGRAWGDAMRATMRGVMRARNGSMGPFPPARWGHSAVDTKTRTRAGVSVRPSFGDVPSPLIGAMADQRAGVSAEPCLGSTGRTGTMVPPRMVPRRVWKSSLAGSTNGTEPRSCSIVS